MATGLELIAAERQRQIEIEGRTPENDDDYASASQFLTMSPLYCAAYCYQSFNDPNWLPPIWPFDQSWWKPSKTDLVRNQVKAGALYQAEFDRRTRAGEKESNKQALLLSKIKACADKIDSLQSIK